MKRKHFAKLPVSSAIATIIEYLWDDESRNFREESSNAPMAALSNHVFVALCVLRTWLEGHEYDPQDYIMNFTDWE